MPVLPLTDITCLDVDLGRDWACCATNDWVVCAPRTLSESSAGQPVRGSSKQHGVQAGVFLGAIAREWEPLSLPIGLRVDGRFGLGSQAERALLFGGQADAVLAVAAPVGMYLLATADWSFD